MRVTDEMVEAFANVYHFRGQTYAPDLVRAALEAALSHAAGQEAVAWQCRLIAIATGEVVDDWRECSKESFDVDGGRPRDGAYLRTEYRALYLTPAQPPASAEVGRDAERTTSKAAVDDAMVERAVRAHRAVRMQCWHPLTNLPAVEREAMEAAIQAAHTTPAAEQGEGA